MAALLDMLKRSREFPALPVANDKDEKDELNGASAPVTGIVSLNSFISYPEAAERGLDLISQDRRVLDYWTDNCEERAAIIEHEGVAPWAWAEALARLDPSKPPADVPLRRWLRFIDDCGRFLDGGWADRAAALGWGPLDLFGCDRERPFARIDHMGLLWLLDGDIVRELHRDRAIIETQSGARQTFRRRPVEVGCVVLAWELAL